LSAELDVTEEEKTLGVPCRLLAGGVEVAVEAPADVMAFEACGGVGENERFPHDGHSRMVGITPLPQLEQY
jgi:hypothetical protein